MRPAMIPGTRAVMAGLVPGIHDLPRRIVRQSSAWGAGIPAVMLGLDPSIHAAETRARRGWPGRARP
jgi:hypothetical protein